MKIRLFPKRHLSVFLAIARGLVFRMIDVFLIKASSVTQHRLTRVSESQCRKKEEKNREHIPCKTWRVPRLITGSVFAYSFVLLWCVVYGLEVDYDDKRETFSLINIVISRLERLRLSDAVNRSAGLRLVPLSELASLSDSWFCGVNWFWYFHSSKFQ